jgi:hypothetical protein
MLFTSSYQTGSGAHPFSYAMGSRGLSWGVTRQRREADHSPPTSTEVKKTWIYTSTTSNAFMAWCLVKRAATTVHLLYLERLEIILYFTLARKRRCRGCCNGQAELICSLSTRGNVTQTRVTRKSNFSL